MKIKIEAGAVKPRWCFIQLVIIPTLILVYDSKYVPYQDKEVSITLNWLWFEVSVIITLNAPQRKSSKKRLRGKGEVRNQ